MRNGGNGSEDHKRVPGREANARPLPRRFYEAVNTAADVDAGWQVLLDGRPARTPGRSILALPTVALADEVAAEWAAQTERIDPARMPLTRLANTAIDGVAARLAEVQADIVKYAGSDLLCYRADFPADLIARQAAAWDPVLDWARERIGARFVLSEGIMPVPQPGTTIERIAEAVAPLDAFETTVAHVMTTLTGSALLALAVIHDHLTPAAAWSAAHVDEDWQISQWGEDAEAAERRDRRRAEMLAAARMLALLR